ncbi:MAG: Type cbb3 cytochrome oxidase biogenesis protein CcoI [Pseudolabrys sp.]|jgi:Cu2+-exporting ATPase|nr:Type cbb3 cytochrome oxidase biogenesis protein CcoI [Pseudolabrys sp.]
MSCCAPGAEDFVSVESGHGAVPSREELLLASRPVTEGMREVRLSVPSIHCGGCLRTIERALGNLDGVADARANLTTKSVTVRWAEGISPPPVGKTLSAIGHPPHLAADGAAGSDKTLSELVRSLAVAGFASANIMAFSVSVWAGVGVELRNLFHLLSAVIALPVLVYSGRVFYRSAWAALRHGRTNMDVPISIGVSLAFAMSLYDMIHGGPHTYFDAAVMLLFFLLIGRTLDHVMRARARTAIGDLAKLTARGATIEREDGSCVYLPVGEIRPGVTILVAAGERVPVDGHILSGTSELDRSLVTGESAPVAMTTGAVVEAGTLNLTAPLRLEATATADDSFLAEMVRLMTAAEAGRSGYRRIADKASGLYAPVVHGAALLSFLGWAFATGDYHRAATIAVAVLIITCPCALSLAVPIVQVIAARRLFEHGIIVKDGAGLERLAEADTVIFDKTGTLTTGRPELMDTDLVDPDVLSLAAALAAHSRHPRSLALVAAYTARGGAKVHVTDIREMPGHGLEARCDGAAIRLGRADWALDDPAAVSAVPCHPAATLSKNGRLLAVFTFHERLRPGAKEAIAALKNAKLDVEILSGDHGAAVRNLADALGVRQFEAGVRPDKKLARLKALADAGYRTFMVGDGLNDAPALAAAHVSMAPSSAVDAGRNAADFVFMRDNLEAVPFAFKVAKRARRLIRENFALAVLYNAIALPFAIAGLVTPLAAALAMSGSSLIVVANAMRLNGGLKRTEKERRRSAGAQAASPSVAAQPAE